MKSWNPRVWLRDWLNQPTLAEVAERARQPALADVFATAVAATLAANLGLPNARSPETASRRHSSRPEAEAR